MHNLFYSATFWANHVDWTATGTLIDRLKATPWGLAAKAFLESGFFTGHIVGAANEYGPLPGTSGNDFIEDLGSHFPITDGAGSDLVIGWNSFGIRADVTDTAGIDVYVAAPLSINPREGNINYADTTQGVLINLQGGGARGSEIGIDRLINIVGARGGSGNDVFIGNDAPLSGFFGGDGFDRMSGFGGFDRLEGGAGNDWISGGDGDDWLNGNEGRDRIFGGAGNDTINWRNEEYFGPNNGDFIDGGAGNDAILGTTGDDIIRGGDGDDGISTSPSWFGGGHDVVFGGAGADVFYVLDRHAENANRTVIADFENGVDKIGTLRSRNAVTGEVTYIMGYAEFEAGSHDSAVGLVFQVSQSLTIIMRGFTHSMLDVSDFS